MKTTTISMMSDEDLLDSYKESGKTIYMGELYIRYLPLLYGVCLKHLNDIPNAQDAVRQIFDNLIDKDARYDVIETFRNWIYDVAKQHCLQQMPKYEYKEYDVEVDSEDVTGEYDEIRFLLEDEDQDEQTALLVNCLNDLPEEQRVSIIDFFVEELSFAEIVDKTGYPLELVKEYIQRGKRNLKICMEKNMK